MDLKKLQFPLELRKFDLSLKWDLRMKFKKQTMQQMLGDWKYPRRQMIQKIISWNIKKLFYKKVAKKHKGNPVAEN